MAKQVNYIVMVEGDTSPALAFTFTGVNITDYVIKLHARRSDGSILTRTATILDAPGGSASFVWQAGDIALPSNANEIQPAEIEITDASSKVRTLQGLALDVRRAIK